MGAGRFPNRHKVETLLNKRWKNKINWTDYISERAMTVSISVINQPVLLMSVYSHHSGYAEQPRNTPNQRSTFKSWAETSTLSWDLAGELRLSVG